MRAFLLILFLTNSAFAQLSDGLFYGDFENPCGASTYAGATLSSISLGEASAGSVIAIYGSGLQPSALRAFLSGPLPGNLLQVELNISSRNPETMVATLEDSLLVGSYDVVIETCTDQARLADAYQAPSISPDFIEPGNQVVMSGVTFGSQPGSIVVDESGEALQASIVNWGDNEIVLTIDSGHSVNGAKDVLISTTGGRLQLKNALVIHWRVTSDRPDQT
jgi:hypothetical protein